MAMQEKYRTRLYAHFVEQIDEETADAVLAEFPARNLDRPASRDFVAVTAAELRTEMHKEFGALRLELQQQTDRLLKRLQVLGGLSVVAITVATSVVATVS